MLESKSCRSGYAYILMYIALHDDLGSGFVWDLRSIVPCLGV